MLYIRMRRNSLTLTIEEFVVAAGFGFPDDAFQPPICELDVKVLIRIWRMQGHVVLCPLLLFTGRISTTQFTFKSINLLIYYRSKTY